MSSDSTSTKPDTETETVAVEHEYVATGDFAKRAARAYTAFVLRLPVMVIIFTIVLVAGILSLVWGVADSSSTYLVIGVAYLLMPVIAAMFTYARMLNGTRKRVPTGSRIAVGLGHTSMRIESPLGSSTTTYRSYTRAYRSGGFVVLRVLGVRLYSLLPAELFPGDDFARLQDGISRAKR